MGLGFLCQSPYDAPIVAGRVVVGHYTDRCISEQLNEITTGRSISARNFRAYEVHMEQTKSTIITGVAIL